VRSSGSTTTTTTATAAAGGAPASGPGAFAAAHYKTDLSKVCPNPIVIQKDWLAEAEHGALYQLIGGGGKLSKNDYSGPLGSTGVNLEILDGGPGLGDGVTTVSSLFAGNLVQNKTPMLAYVGTDDAVQFSKKFPVTAVVSPLAKQPTMLMYDPSNYPDLKTVQDVVNSGAKIYVTALTNSYVQYLIGQGVPQSRFITGYAGDKEKFITSGGKIINQGYVSNEVYSYEHETKTWDKPVKYILVDDLGYRPYPSALSVRTDKLQSLSACLKGLVPLIQQAQIDYSKDPTEVNDLLTKYNPKYSASFWFTSKGLSDAAVSAMKSTGIISDQPDGFGSFDTARMQTLIDILKPIFAKQGIDTYKTDVTPADVVSNQFIDPSIKLGS
jgi:hypothetical protein